MKYISHGLEFYNEAEDKVFVCILPRNSYDENKRLKINAANNILEKLRIERMFWDTEDYKENVEYEDFINQLYKKQKDLGISEMLCTEFSDEKEDEEMIFSSIGSYKEKLEHIKKLSDHHEPSYSRDIDEVLPVKADNEV